MYGGDGIVRVRYIYDSWGNTLSVQDANGKEITDPNHMGNLNPMRYRGYYFDTETGLYYLHSRYYDPQTCRFVNGDGYVSTGQGILGSNMFAYCENNPVNRIDPSGEIAITATITGTAIGVALWKFGMVLLGIMVTYLIVDALVNSPSISLPSNAKPKTDAKEKDIAPTIPKKPKKDKPTVIYRYYASKTENLAPRVNVDYDGLSFSTKPPKPGVSAVVTTIEQVNETGILHATFTGSTHVSIVPTNGTVIQWMEQGQSSVWSQVLSEVVVEWDGGN